jgi:hypothetical protein
MFRIARQAALVFALSALALAGATAQGTDGVEALHRPLDQLLDVNVRDGLVYYRALQGERGRLDRYIASLNVPAGTYDGWSREARMAFWLNAYNAVVLQTVINRYPIAGRAAAYPAASIRQIPGAFETARHRLAGRSLSLDDIEKTVLPEFADPRLYLALGRGAVGSGRLRSEAYTGARLSAQLDAVQADFVDQQVMFRIDRLSGQMAVTSIVSWHEREFVAAYDKGPVGTFAGRSPIERAVLAFIMPHLLRLEREHLEANTFQVVFQPFDWRLNDLTGGGRAE